MAADDTRPAPLVMPADEFAAVKAAAEACGPVTAAGALEVTTPADAPANRSGAATARPCACSHDGWYDPRCACCNDRLRPVDWKARAEAAEAKLAEVRSVLLEGGQGDATARCRAIAIVGTGEADRG